MTGSGMRNTERSDAATVSGIVSAVCVGCSHTVLEP